MSANAQERNYRSAAPADRAAGVAAARPPVPITLRAIVVGTVCVAVMAGFSPYTSYVSGTWIPGTGALLGGPLQALFLLLILNSALKRVWSAAALTRGELLVAYGVETIAVATVYGSTAAPATMIAYPFHMASRANGWQELILPYVPGWFGLPHPNVAHWLWEGLPAGEPLPWSAWTTPMLATSAFYLAIMTAMFCLGSLLSRDWIERQRLSYPIAEIPLALTGQEGRPTFTSGLFGLPLFWTGLSLPTAMVFLNWLSGLYPSVPHLSYGADLGRPFREMGLPWSVLGDMQFEFHWSAFGIAALLPGEVSLSLWLFHVLYRVQTLIWASFGITSQGTTSWGEVGAGALDPHALNGLAEAGGFMALSALVIHQSRAALKSAWCGLRDHRYRGDGAGPHGTMAGRWAILGFMLSTLFVMWWSIHSGMSWWYAGVLLGLFYTYCVCTSRLVAAGGVMYPSPQMAIPDILSRSLGLAMVGRRSLITATYMDSMFLTSMYRVDVPMAHMMNSFRILHSGRISGRRYAWATSIAVVAMLATALPMMLWAAYRFGGSTMNAWHLNVAPQRSFATLEAGLLNTSGPSLAAWLAVLAGAGFTFALVHMHMHYVWWPVSPIGFIIASSEITNRTIWHNYLFGWLINILICRYGGLRLYTRLRPAFLGMIVGNLLGWFVFYVGGQALGFRPAP